MKILSFDRKSGLIKILITNNLDLWHLSRIIKPKDKIIAKSLRSVFIRRGEKKEKVGKKLMKLGIEVEKIELEKERLRVIGRIREAPEEVKLGSFHSLDLKVGTIFFLQKEWEEEELKRLEFAQMKIKEKRETLNEFFLHLAKQDGFSIYGKEEVKKVSSTGAIKVLIVCEDNMMEKDVERMMEEVRERGGEIILASKKDKLGKKFCKTYGIGAILRFRVY